MALEAASCLPGDHGVPLFPLYYQLIPSCDRSVFRQGFKNEMKAYEGFENGVPLVPPLVVNLDRVLPTPWARSDGKISSCTSATELTRSCAAAFACVGFGARGLPTEPRLEGFYFHYQKKVSFGVFFFFSNAT